LRNSDCKTRWRFGVLAALAVTLVAFAPQLYFSLSKGSHWNGAYAQTHGDESVYASYLNALIDGRPRRNNPYSGRDDSPEHPAAESYLSVQFLPPVLIATTARLVTVSSTKAFMALTVITAFASALAVFWLLASILKDSRLAAIGVLAVLLASSANLIAEYLFGLGAANNYLPFLRRYLPAASFPIMLIYCGLLLQMLTATSKRVASASVVSAGVLFAVLVFSYFYHWTFAVVWTVCLAGIWLAVRQHERKRVALLLLILAGFMIAAGAPYFVLISRLGATTGEAHFMAASHKPDLFRLTELFGVLIVALIGFMVSRGRVKASEPTVIFTLACAVTPFLLFNQQILTGKSLQPFHYEVFIGSYTTALAAFVAVILLWRGFTVTSPAVARILLTLVAGGAVLSGSAEATLMTRRQLPANQIRDDARPALLRLAQIARQTKDGSLDTKSVVYAPDFIVASSISTTAPQPVLWAPYLFVFPDVTLMEDKERLASFLYYKDVNFNNIDQFRLESLDNEQSYYLSSLIGRGRFNPRLSVNWQPIAADEVHLALDYYRNFVATFDRTQAARPLVSYLLLSADDPVKLSNFDRWYERDEGEHVGNYILFRVRLRS
jgi:hypothetical protein